MIGRVEDPLQSAVAEWLKLLFWALRATQLYPPGNDARRQHVARAHAELGVLLSHASSIRLRIRGGRLHFGTGVVHEDDNDDGIVWSLFYAGLVELTFSDCVEPWELEALLDVIRADYSRRRADGEDLVTSLWRLDLPHIGHRDRDLLADAVERGTGGRGERDGDSQARRIRTALETLTARIAVNEVNGEDMVQMIDGRVETPEARHRAARTVHAYFDAAAQRCASRIPPKAAATLAKELGTKNGHEGIVSHLCVLLIDALRRNPTPRVSTPARTVLLQMFDSMLTGKRFDTAARVAGRIAKWERIAKNENEAEQAKELLVEMASPAHIIRAFGAKSSATEDLANMKSLLEVLGDRVVPALMETIERVEDAGARRIVAKQIVDAQSDVKALAARLPEADEEVALLYLTLTKDLDSNERAALIWAALEHPAEKPRAEAIRALSTYKRGKADRVIINALTDSSALVRAAALRAIRVRGISDGFEPVARFVRSDAFTPGLGALAVETLAITGRERAVPYLRDVALSGTLFGAPAEDGQRVAIEALGGLRTADAVRTLQHGAGSLSARLKEACREALARTKPPVWLERVVGDRFADADALLSRELEAIDDTEIATAADPTLGVHAEAIAERERMPSAIFKVRVPADTPNQPSEGAVRLPTHALVEVPAELRRAPPRLATSALAAVETNRLPSSALLPALTPEPPSRDVPNVSDLLLADPPTVDDAELTNPATPAHEDTADEAAALLSPVAMRTAPFVPQYAPSKPRDFEDPDATVAEPPAIDAFDDLDDEATLGVDPDTLARVSAALRHLEEDG